MGTMAEPLTGAIALPDGTLIRGRGRREPVPAGPLPEIGLWLGRPPGRGRRLRRAGAGPVVAAGPSWPVEWVDWPDFRTPRDAGAAADALRRAYESARA